MRVRRCAVLFIQAEEDLSFSLESLLRGGAGLESTLRWRVVAPHLAEKVELFDEDISCLGKISAHYWKEVAEPSPSMLRLIKEGLIIECERYPSHAERDQRVRDMKWWPLGAAYHFASRWQGVDAVASTRRQNLDTAEEMVDALGLPPSEIDRSYVGRPRIALVEVESSKFDDGLARRVTCRNFDSAVSISAKECSTVLKQVFGAQATVGVGGATFIKKNAPSAGGLHSIEPYIIIQHVQDIPPALYHYNALTHVLELVVDEVDVYELALRALGQQCWFANSAVQVVLVARFERCFWKYRSHSKAYRAQILDAGHLSQLLYQAATNLGLGAFVTSAINEIDIEKMFGLDELTCGPIAICGFGPRAQDQTVTEFDPLGEVWSRSTP